MMMYYNEEKEQKGPLCYKGKLLLLHRLFVNCRRYDLIGRLPVSHKAIRKNSCFLVRTKRRKKEPNLA